MMIVVIFFIVLFLILFIVLGFGEMVKVVLIVIGILFLMICDMAVYVEGFFVE